MYHNFHILKVLEVGVDWITATVRPGSKMTVVGGMAEKWYLDRQEDGWQGKGWRWNGYSGSTCDGISYGRREDGLIVRLSGVVALMHWRTLASYADNVSRLDLQVTAEDDDLKNLWAHMVKADSRFDARISNGMTKTGLIESTPAGSTFTIGSRSSDRYFRVYDKTAESLGEYPAGSWRWEIEYKGALSNAVSEGLMKLKDTENAVIHRLRQDFFSYGVNLPVNSVPMGWRPAFVGRVTDDQRRLEWLRRCIRPMVDRMSEAYDVETLSNALGFHWVGDTDTGVSAVYLLHDRLGRDDETGTLPVDTEVL